MIFVFLWIISLIMIISRSIHVAANDIISFFFYNWITFHSFFCAVLSCSIVSDSWRLHELHPARLLCLWGCSRQQYWSGLSFPSPGNLPSPGMEPRSPTLQADSLPSELPGKPKITGVDSQSLLQGIFPTQGWNPGLPHCKQILYHLSHQGRTDLK